MGKIYLLLAIVVATLLTGCRDASTQVFLPGISSEAAATEAAYIPAVQANDSAYEEESLSTPHGGVAEESNTDIVEQENTIGKANADVLFVKAQQSQTGAWTFSVTVAHPDTGWEDYADGWDVVLPDGTIVKPDPESPFTRLLLHPHEEEQPFTRNQTNIEIPADVEKITVRAHDLVDGYGGSEIVVDLTVAEGAGFEVTRN